MPQKPILLTIAIAAVSLLIAFLLLPGIAGLIEGDFEYPLDQADRGWNKIDNVTVSEAVGDIYKWSFWRLGLYHEAPVSYTFFAISRLIKSSVIPRHTWP